MVDININGGVLCCSYIASRLAVTMAAHARLRELELGAEEEERCVL